MRIFRWISLTLTLSAFEASAIETSFMNVGNITNQNLGTWAIGDGTQTLSLVHCAASSNYNNGFNDPPPVRVPPAVHAPYEFKILDRAGPAGYFLYLDNDDANTGNARIAVQFEHRDIKDTTAFETLADNVYDSHSHDGQFKKCKNGDNSEVQVTILNADLEKAKAGSYRGRFRMVGRGGSPGLVNESDNFRIDIDIAPAVRISSLDNIAFGTWSGTGGLSAEETFCVYNNTSTSAYEVTITSPNQDGSSNFFVTDGGVKSVGYQLQFKDDVLPGGGSTVGALAIGGVGDNNDLDCGGDNAKLTVNFLEADLSASSSAVYTDTVTLVVSPI